MFYIGIDIAKRNHEAIIIDDDGSIIEKSFSFKNNNDGYEKLIDTIKNISYYKNQFIFGMESTSHYWLPLYSKLTKDGYTVHVINPIQSDALRGLYIRKTKTDSKDSLIIADLIRFGRYSKTDAPKDKQHALRELSRNRSYIVGTIGDMKRKVIAMIDQIFPKYETLFSDIFLISSTELLIAYPTPELMCKARTDTLTKLLFKHSCGHFGKAKALEIKEKAKNTFGVADSCGVYSDLISSYLLQIKNLQSQVNMIEKKIKSMMDEMDSQILSITGIGYILGATIISEIGDITRFKSADKLAAFAGMDPSVKQSGDYTSAKNRISKRGSPYLRRAIWLATFSAINNDPMFREYFDKKRSEGKSFMKAMGHSSKKFISVLYAVLRDNEPYIPYKSSLPTT